MASETISPRQDGLGATNRRDNIDPTSASLGLLSWKAKSK